jgi:hypothetical protein
VGAAQADNPHRRTRFGEDQSMKAVPDITEREKASFAVAAGRCDHGCGPIEFSGEREREAPQCSLLALLVSQSFLQRSFQIPEHFHRLFLPCRLFHGRNPISLL